MLAFDMATRYYPVDPVSWAVTRLDPQQLERLDDLLDAFNEDLEKYFSADVECCDSCHETFTASWPLVYQRDSEFQCVQLDHFYSNSRLVRAQFSRDEFAELIRFGACPRCLEPLRDNIWAYAFRFSIPDGFETQMNELATLANRTPFLVLDHPLAQRVRAEIQSLASTLQPFLLDTPIYRGRELDVAASPVPADLLPPPAHLTPEGRYNHAGKPVLYGASDRQTCFEECRRPTKPFYVARYPILKELRLLDFLAVEDTSDVLAAVVTSSLVSGPTAKDAGSDKPEYVFSRFVADCASAAGLDGIRYSSVRHATGYNIVLFNRGDWADTIDLHNSRVERLHSAAVGRGAQQADLD